MSLSEAAAVSAPIGIGEKLPLELHRWVRLLRRGTIILPLLVLIVWGAISWQSHRRAAEDEAQDRVRIIREYALRVLQSHLMLLDRATDALIVDGASGRSTAIASRVLAGLSAETDTLIGLGYLTPQGVMEVSSSPAAAGLDLSESEFFRQLTLDPRLGFFIDRTTLKPSGRDAIMVAKRSKARALPGIIVAAIRVETFTDFFAEVADNSGYTASLLRSDGRLLVRQTPEAPPLSIDTGSPFMRAIARSTFGVYQAKVASDGVTRIYATAKLGEYPVFANFGIARSLVFRRWVVDTGQVALFLAVCAASAYAIVGEVGRRVVAEALGREAELDRRMLDESRKTAAMRETLLHELNHRVKNSLQTIQALIRLGRGSDAPPDEVLGDVEARVLAVAKVHELLYRSQAFSRLQLDELLGELCRSSGIMPADRPVRIDPHLAPVEVSIDQAVPLALITIELITHALEREVLSGQDAKVLVRLRQAEPGMAVMSVARDGLGPAPSLEQQRAPGLRLVRGLVDQIGGTLDWGDTRDLLATLRFPTAEIEAAAA